MIVTCSECDTQFRLDDTKVSPKGIRVRCSVCKHAFRVSPEVSGDADRSAAIAELASEAVETATARPNAQAPVPAATADLGEESRLPAAQARDADLDDWSEDWEFNDQLESGAAAAVDTGAEADFDSEAATRVVEKRAVDDWLSARPAASDEASEGLGNPDEWDFFEEGGRSAAAQSSAGAAPPAASAAAVAAPDSLEHDLLESDEDEPFGRADALGFESRDASELNVVVDELGPRERPAWLAKLGAGIAWSAVAGMFGFGLVLGIPPAARNTAPATSQQVGDLVVDAAESRWIENAHAGSLLVISGTLRNPTERQRERMGVLSLQLIEPSGRGVPESETLAGLPVPIHELREGDPSELLESIDRSARERSNRSLASGEPWHFQALMTAEPGVAVGYRFEMLPADATARTQVESDGVSESAPNAAAESGLEAESELEPQLEVKPEAFLP